MSLGASTQRNAEPPPLSVFGLGWGSCVAGPSQGALHSDEQRGAGSSQLKGSNGGTPAVAMAEVLWIVFGISSPEKLRLDTN